jgi:ATP-dependent RNA helicase RhlE
MTPQQTGASFNNLGIAPKLLEILHNLKFETPTPIQEQSIPSAIQGKDLMGIAQTGTGKTLAFGIPMIQRLAQSNGAKGEKPKGLVILPTRELALQVDETLRKIGAGIGLKTAIMIGGESMDRQIKALRRDPHILIATPGRLIDHLESRRIDLGNVKILVLDEADRMLDMGFAPQIKKILQAVSKERQTMLFSATMPDEIMGIAKSYMSLPLRIEVAPAGSAIDLVSQELFFVHREEKLSLLKNVLAENNGSMLVFSRTKHGAKKIAKSIRDMGYSSAEIHSNRSLNQRLEALEGFKIGKYRVLVATDIAARGIHVTGIQLVVNYDLPDNAEDYVHRIGRTGRAGITGRAISFATPEQRGDVKSIERLIRMSLPISKTPTLERVKREERSFDEPGRRRPAFGERKPFAPRRSFGGPSRGSSRDGDRKPFGERKSLGGPSKPSSFGSSSGPRRSSSGPGRSSGGRPPSRGRGRSDSKFVPRRNAERNSDDGSRAHYMTRKPKEDRYDSQF